MKVVVLYVGSSLLAPLRSAEREINRQYGLDLRVATHNFGGPFADDEWRAVESDLSTSDVIFVIHVMDGENAARLLPVLAELQNTLIVINCMPELMKRTRMGKLDLARLSGAKGKAQRAKGERKGARLLGSVSTWVGRQAKSHKKNNGHGRADYLKLAARLPRLLRFIPSSGPLRDAKNYLLLVSYFLQPTPGNIQSMILLALKSYAAGERLEAIEIPPPEVMASQAIYHPDAPSLFESFEEYEAWYLERTSKHQVQSTKHIAHPLKEDSTIGLLLMRPQIVSRARKHYDTLIRAIEAEGLSVIPALSTLMDNREAVEKFFIGTRASGLQHAGGVRSSRVSQIVSLTGFSFVGGPAMNDSDEAAAYLKNLNVPYRSLVSLDTQTIDSWRESFTGLNPVQMGMQVAIPEIDGATEPFVFGGIPARGEEPVALEERCTRVAKRLRRWQRLQTTPRANLKVALVLYCFPPTKGNIGTAADLEVFDSVSDILVRMRDEGYSVDVPADGDLLRKKLLTEDPARQGIGKIAYCMPIEEYRALCPFFAEIEKEWGEAPGKINSTAAGLLIEGIHLNNVFIGIQPTFGYEDDPMRLLMARGGTPHHGFAAFYAYLDKIFHADVVVHVGTHGAMEFMPGKQVGMSDECWPDRLVGELPNIYIYSVNNPSEGTIAKRRSYAELISYLTPPIEDAGLYKGLATLKDLISGYRAAANDTERDTLYRAIEETRREMNL